VRRLRFEFLLVARQDLVGELRAANLHRARAALDAAIDQLRDAIFELHPAVLEHVGLAAAVEAVAERAARRGGFEVAVEIEVSSSGGPSEGDVLLLMTSRELLANAAEHSGASRVTVRIFEPQGRVFLEVRDDGCGFERRRLRRALEEGHIGLASTAERIAAVGGTFEIESTPGSGTTIRASVPRHANPTLGREPAGRLVTDLDAPLVGAAG
jgi:two-component system NarL family sensor kinase